MNHWFYLKIGIVLLIGFCIIMVDRPSLAGTYKEVPVKGMVTLIDLGANACIPCKMMAPIMARLEKNYKGKAAITSIDVWKYPAQTKRFGVRVIPTQIFYDRTGKEVYRHQGFMGEKEIVAQLKKMGVQ